MLTHTLPLVVLPWKLSEVCHARGTDSHGPFCLEHCDENQA